MPSLLRCWGLLHHGLPDSKCKRKFGFAGLWSVVYLQEPTKQLSHLQPCASHSRADQPDDTQCDQQGPAVPCLQCLHTRSPGSSRRVPCPLPHGPYTYPCCSLPSCSCLASVSLPNEPGHQCVCECVGGHLFPAGAVGWHCQNPTTAQAACGESSLSCMLEG